MDLTCRDTVAALLTGSSDGALAVVRVSGPDTVRIRDAVFTRARPGPWRPATLHLGLCRGLECLAAWFPPGRSYTGEESLEIQGFGGRAGARALLGAVLGADARQAEPGEFTLRAFLHGRLSLDQAEGVAAQVAAQTSLGLQEAAALRQGALHAALAPVRAQLLDLLAESEAYLDFPEEGLPPGSAEARDTALQGLAGVLDRILEGGVSARRLVEGARVVLWGAPNVGKSSLFNVLCGRERSIVDPEPGTTRDVVEVTVEWEGVPVTLVDTAGVRDQGGRVELEGVRRSGQAAAAADLVLWCLRGECGEDGTGPPASASVLRVATQCDRGPPATVADFKTSAVTGEGVTALRERVGRLLAGPARTEGGAVAVTARQQGLVRAARESLQAARASRAAGEPEEVTAEWLRRSARSVGQVTGQEMPAEEVLEAIFSRFCMGK